MRTTRLAAGFGLAGWLVGGLVGHFFEGGLALGVVCGLLAAILGAVLGAPVDVIDALPNREPQPLPPIPPSESGC